MKKLSLLSLIFCFTICLSAQDFRNNRPITKPTKVQKKHLCDDSDWELVFYDEFNGNALDTSKWVSYYPFGKNFSDECLFCRIPSPSTDHIFRDENVVVENGSLNLWARKEKGEWYGVEKPYTAGIIFTKKQYRFTYGRFEIRCKIPEGRGLIPAFWIWSGEREIDVFEIGTQNPDHVHTTIHRTPKPEERNFWSKNIKKKIGTREFHTYSLEWSPSNIIWFIDGEEVRRITRYLSASGNPIDCPDENSTDLLENLYLHDGPLALIANNSVADDENPFTKAPNKKTKFPLNFEIDYIRVYQQKPSKGLKDVCAHKIEGPTTLCGKSISLTYEGAGKISSWKMHKAFKVIKKEGNSVEIGLIDPNFNGSAWVEIQLADAISNICPSGNPRKVIHVGKPNSPYISSSYEPCAKQFSLVDLNDQSAGTDYFWFSQSRGGKITNNTTPNPNFKLEKDFAAPFFDYKLKLANECGELEHLGNVALENCDFSGAGSTVIDQKKSISTEIPFKTKEEVRAIILTDGSLKQFENLSFRKEGDKIWVAIPKLDKGVYRLTLKLKNNQNISKKIAIQ